MVLPLRDENPTRRRAYLTLAIIAANVLVFTVYQPSVFRTELGQTDIGQRTELRFLFDHAAVPCEISHGEQLSQRLVDECRGASAALRQGADTQPLDPTKNIYLAVLVSMFLHASWAHLLGNMLFLWIFGNNVEDRLTPIPFLVFYAFCGIAAALAHVFYDPNNVFPVLGASGAIAGVMGAYLVFFPRARILTLVPLIFFARLPAWLVLIGWFLLQFATGPNSSVAWVAHVGGFIAGVIVGFMVRPWAMRGAIVANPYGYDRY